MKKSLLVGMLITVVLLVGSFIPMAALAAGPGDVVITTSYPWVVAEKGKAVTFSLNIDNKGTAYQDLDLQAVDAPAEWAPLFKDGATTVRRVTVAPGKTQVLEFQATPPTEAKANDYNIMVKGLGPGGALVSDLKLTVSLSDKVGTGLKMTSQYPDLRGQAGTTFSYKLDVNNGATEDRAVNFSGNAPQGWEVTFKPAYDSKQVSSIRMKSGDNQGVDVDIKPVDKVEPGEYTVKIQAAAGNDRVEVPVKVVIVGNYKLSLVSMTGQLNTKATVDQASKFSMAVRNVGATTLQNVSLSSSKPDGWDVTFTPEKIDSIAPGEFKELTVNVKPGGRSLAGDYMVTVTASGQQTSDNKDIRVTVETPTTWGWAGIGVIVIVLGGLGLLFGRLSRR